MSYIVRKRSGEKKYAKYKKTAPKGCDFCSLKMGDGQVVRELERNWIILTRFPYDFWDSSEVTEHMMVVPKRHVLSLSEYNEAERNEYFNALAEYEGKGYSIYSRGVDIHTRTMPHVHTHLIKLGKIKNAVLYVRKPHTLLIV